MRSFNSRLQRESSFELLRIVCMLMIVCHHFITQVDKGSTLINNSTAGAIINALCYVGVNCFVLISGWFGIKIKWKGIISLFICCSFYGVLSYFFHIFTDHANVGISLIQWALLPLSSSKWWFVNCYLILYLSSPLLNVALEHLSRKEHVIILWLFTIINVYFGSIMQADFFNQDGYSAAQMIYMYIIGDYLRKYTSVRWVQDNRMWLLVGYVVFSLLWLLHKQLRFSIGITSFCGTGYNNVFILCSSICFFLFMASFHFHYKLVNYVAISAFSVYLLQESTYFGRNWLYPRVASIYTTIGSTSGQICVMLAISVLFFLFVILIDQIRLLISSGITFLIESAFLKNRTIV